MDRDHGVTRPRSDICLPAEGTLSIKILIAYCAGPLRHFWALGNFKHSFSSVSCDVRHLLGTWIALVCSRNQPLRPSEITSICMRSKMVCMQRGPSRHQSKQQRRGLPMLSIKYHAFLCRQPIGDFPHFPGLYISRGRSSGFLWADSIIQKNVKKGESITAIVISLRAKQ
jgi:hypothetical protein